MLRSSALVTSDWSPAPASPISDTRSCASTIASARVDALRNGRIPFYEPGLGELVARNASAGRLSFSGNLADAVRGCYGPVRRRWHPRGHDGRCRHVTDRGGRV